MKVLVLILILGVLGFGVFEYHEETKPQERGRLERAVSDCWRDVAPLGPSGVATCERMAKRLEEVEK